MEPLALIVLITILCPVVTVGILAVLGFWIEESIEEQIGR